MIIPFVKEKIKVKHGLAFPTDAPAMLVKEMIDTLPLLVLKTIKVLSIQSKAATYLLNCYCLYFFDLFLSIK